MKIIILSFVLTFSALANEIPPIMHTYIQVGEKRKAMSTVEEMLVLEARSIAKIFKTKLGNKLKSSISSRGLPDTIRVCSDTAPKIALDLSAKTIAKITRISLKTRNSNIGIPDVWERSALREFEENKKLLREGTVLEKSQITNESGTFYYRYVQALGVKPVCLSCHGSVREISKRVKDKINEIYPGDMATGYKQGDIRGAISIKKLLQ